MRKDSRASGLETAARSEAEEDCNSERFIQRNHRGTETQRNHRGDLKKFTADGRRCTRMC